MKRLISASLLILLAGCGGSSARTTQADRTKAAILRVLQEDNRLCEGVKKLSPGTPPSQVALAVGEYCDEAGRLDLSECPPDFRVAYRHHIEAWREAQGVIKELPDTFLQGFLMGAINGFLRNEADGGTARVEGQLRRALEGIRETFHEVERIGVTHGAAL